MLNTELIDKNDDLTIKVQEVISSIMKQQSLDPQGSISFIKVKDNNVDIHMEGENQKDSASVRSKKGILQFIFSTSAVQRIFDLTNNIATYHISLNQIYDRQKMVSELDQFIHIIQNNKSEGQCETLVSARGESLILKCNGSSIKKPSTWKYIKNVWKNVNNTPYQYSLHLLKITQHSNERVCYNLNTIIQTSISADIIQNSITAEETTEEYKLLINLDAQSPTNITTHNENYAPKQEEKTNEIDNKIDAEESNKPEILQLNKEENIEQAMDSNIILDNISISTLTDNKEYLPAPNNKYVKISAKNPSTYSSCILQVSSVLFFMVACLSAGLSYYFAKNYTQVIIAITSAALCLTAAITCTYISISDCINVENVKSHPKDLLL